MNPEALDPPPDPPRVPPGADPLRLQAEGDDQSKHRHGRMCDRVVAMGADIQNFQYAFTTLLEKLHALQEEVRFEGMTHEAKMAPLAPCPDAASPAEIVQGIVESSFSPELRPSSVPKNSTTGHIASDHNAGGNRSRERASSTEHRPSVNGISSPTSEELTKGDDHAWRRDSACFEVAESGPAFRVGESRPMRRSIESEADGRVEAPWISYQSLPKLVESPQWLRDRWEGNWAVPTRFSGEFRSQTFGRTGTMSARQDKSYKLDGLWVGLEILSSSTKEEEDEDMDELAQSSSFWYDKKGSALEGVLQFVPQLMPKSYIVINPHSKACMSWDAFGAFLLCYDIIVIPLMVAWDLELKGFSFFMFVLAILYWTTDIFRGFCTSIYSHGELVSARSRIVLKYARTWLIPDVLIISIDYIILAGGENLTVFRSARALRLLRLMRLVRLLKMSRNSQTIDDTVGMAGVAGMILVVALVKTFIGIFVCAHLISCAWYYIGRLSIDEGRQSWILTSNIESETVGHQYLHALHWVFGQFTPAPVQIQPGCALERGFNILVIIFSLLVMGSSVSKVTGTIQQLNAMNSEKQRKRLEIRQYMSANKIPIELSSRIMSFANHKLEGQCQVSLDKSLMSEALQKELTMFQRSSGLCVHPMLQMLDTFFEHVFCDVCGVTAHCLYGKEEVVFSTGSWAEGLVVTVNGEYLLQAEINAGHRANQVLEKKVDQPTWFAEASMFCRMVHTSTLTAQSFGGIFKLVGSDLAQCAKKSPRCGIMICEYAKAYLQNKHSGAGAGLDFDPIDVANDACKATSIQSEKDMKAKSLVSLSVRREDWREYSSEEAVQNFLERVLAGKVDDSDLTEEVEKVFPELHRVDGIYAQLDKHHDRKCCMTSILSVIWLLTDRYQNFTEPQARAGRLSVKQWADLQLFVKWSNMNIEMIQAVLAFLAIRGLGKACMISSQLPPDAQGPEQTVLHLIEFAQNVVPSASRMSDTLQDMVKTNLGIHSQFNLGQMMQGENTPFNVKHLQDCTQGTDDVSLKFYLFSLVGILCGNGGDGGQSQGSRFMNAKNGSMTLLCMSSLQQLGSKMAQEIYWSYIVSRSQMLKLQTCTPQEIAMARLVCLNRANDPEEVAAVSEAWSSLGIGDRNLLTQHFLNDGIVDKTFLFAFLPLCFANARENLVVGLAAAMAVLAEIIELVYQHVHTEKPQTDSGTLVTVDLSDLAVFFATVKSNSVLLTCVMQSKFVASGSSLCLKMNWSQVNCVDNQDFDVGSGLIRIMRNQRAFGDALANIKLDILALRGEAPDQEQYGEVSHYSPESTDTGSVQDHSTEFPSLRESTHLTPVSNIESLKCRFSYRGT